MRYSDTRKILEQAPQSRRLEKCLRLVTEPVRVHGKSSLTASRQGDRLPRNALEDRYLLIMETLASSCPDAPGSPGINRLARLLYDVSDDAGEAAKLFDGKGSTCDGIGYVLGIPRRVP